MQLPELFSSANHWIDALHATNHKVLIRWLDMAKAHRLATNQGGRSGQNAMPLITVSGNLNHRYRDPGSGLMLVSFCSRSTLACLLSSCYGVIHALYRVIDTRLRG